MLTTENIEVKGNISGECFRGELEVAIFDLTPTSANLTPTEKNVKSVQSGSEDEQKYGRQTDLVPPMCPLKLLKVAYLRNPILLGNRNVVPRLWAWSTLSGSHRRRQNLAPMRPPGSVGGLPPPGMVFCQADDRGVLRPCLGALLRGRHLPAAWRGVRQAAPIAAAMIWR